MGATSEAPGVLTYHLLAILRNAIRNARGAYPTGRFHPYITRFGAYFIRCMPPLNPYATPGQATYQTRPAQSLINQPYAQTIKQAIHQPIAQSANQALCQSTNQSRNQSIAPPTNRSRQSIDQSTNEEINQQSITRSLG